jgi:hypothetical protein
MASAILKNTQSNFFYTYPTPTTPLKTKRTPPPPKFYYTVLHILLFFYSSLFRFPIWKMIVDVDLAAVVLAAEGDVVVHVVAVVGVVCNDRLDDDIGDA